MAVQGITPPDGNKTGNAAPRRQPQGRSFAEVYAALDKAGNNDNTPQGRQQQQDPKALANQKYIKTLHEGVDTLRGEILARVILTAQNKNIDPNAVTDDISRLSVRLDKLKTKLQTAESTLSGKLVDLSV